MTVWNDIPGLNNELYRFRRRHFFESLSGRKGVFVLMKITAFTHPSVLYVKASNDLAEVEGKCLESTKLYREAKRRGCNAVAIFMTGRLPASKVVEIADSIRAANDPPLNGAVAQ